MARHTKGIASRFPFGYIQFNQQEFVLIQAIKVENKFGE
jgi:hypothetical protein